MISLKKYLHEQDRVETLTAALNKIIQMCRETALAQYGNAEKAELWACVITARQAMADASISPGF
jgi:hypothetical protein